MVISTIVAFFLALFLLQIAVIAAIMRILRKVARWSRVELSTRGGERRSARHRRVRFATLNHLDRRAERHRRDYIARCGRHLDRSFPGSARVVQATFECRLEASGRCWCWLPGPGLDGNARHYDDGPHTLLRHICQSERRYGHDNSWPAYQCDIARTVNTNSRLALLPATAGAEQNTSTVPCVGKELRSPET